MRERTGHGTGSESPDQDGRHGMDQDGPHDTSTVERGSFTHACCSCGWLGPARRSRGTSRADAAAHGTHEAREV
ncbi:hypothetical protein ACFPA8_11280 [Streptomyces ovatisporus]|uniref:Uncharacterized protein n=1 Tax=Streptomyces ovatisporus TaxID=1128682 RepID=A0ABV9A846_9ACTN